MEAEMALSESFEVARIAGTPRLAGVTGWPVGHSLSPAIHNAAYREMDLDWVYVPLPVEHVRDLPALAEALRVLPFVGLNVTMPYKDPVMELCDEVSTVAELSGAVNAVHVRDGRLFGYNTDGRGMCASLESEAGFAVKGSNVVLVGAGGAAASAFVAFVLEGAASVTIVNRTLARAEAVLSRLDGRTRDTAVAALVPDADAREAVAGADLLVNATPLGMRSDDALPVPAEWLHEGLLVADMVYRPSVTPLLAQARLAGARVLGGLGMLVEQAAMSIEIWNEDAHQRAPRETMRAAAAAALAGQET
jgi:shikimate dehydrogenase